jgi:hypothetical protein
VKPIANPIFTPLISTGEVLVEYLQSIVDEHTLLLVYTLPRVGFYKVYRRLFQINHYLSVMTLELLDELVGCTNQIIPFDTFLLESVEQVEVLDME